MIMPFLLITVQTADEKHLDGWYYLRCMNYYLNIDSEGVTELLSIGILATI
jgi:hypothetical protein